MITWNATRMTNQYASLFITSLVLFSKHVAYIIGGSLESSLHSRDPGRELLCALHMLAKGT
jgi:hypothetical protein